MLAKNLASDIFVTEKVVISIDGNISFGSNCCVP